MNAKLLRKHFGSHEVPPLLDELAAFTRKNEGLFSGEFELSDFDGEDVAELMVGQYADGVARFGARIRQRLALFGSDADGSQYGFWFDAGQPSAKAPVVYINSEGSDDTDVIAGNLAEFVSLLLLDVSDVGMFYSEVRDREDEHAERHKAFVKWAKAKGITVASNPKKLVAAAQGAHPGFRAWLTRMRDELEETEPETTEENEPPASEPYVCWLKVGKAQAKVEAATQQVLAAVRAKLPGLELECRSRIGLTAPEASDFPTTGAFPAGFTKATELRLVFNRDDEQVVCVVIQPPGAGDRKTFEATLWLADQPARDAAYAGVLKGFEAAFAKLS